MSAERETGPASAGPLFDAAARATRVLTGAVLVALVTLVCGEAFLRSVFNYSLGFAEELAGYCVVLLTFFGAALALRSGALFQVHFVFDSIPAGARRLAIRFFAVAAFGICAVLVWKTGDLALSSLGRGKFAPTVLRTPLWIPQRLRPLGLGLIGFFLVEKFGISFRKS